MNILKKLALITPTLMLMLSFTSIPVMAQDGTSGSGDTTTGQTTTTSHSGTDATQVKTETETETHTASVSPEVQKETEDQNTQHAKSQLLEMEKNGQKKHKDDERKKNCQGLQHGLETKLTNLGNNAAKHQAHIDEVLTKAEAYQAQNKVVGVDELIAKAKAAQLKALASVTALQNLKPTIDCNDPNVAQIVATFKAAATTTHTDLVTYRQSVKAVLTLLEQTRESGDAQQ